MHYKLSSVHRNFWRSSVTILVVQRHGAERQEEPATSVIHQISKNQSRRGQPFASGLLLGAIAGAGMVRWLLEAHSKKAARQERDVFSWPAIVKPGQR